MQELLVIMSVMSLSLEKAIAVVGSQSALARALVVSPQAVNQWLKSKVPAERVLEIEGATKGQVTRHDLRPDLYPNPTDALPCGQRRTDSQSEEAA